MITKNPTSRTLIIRPLGDLDTLRTDHYRRQLRTLVDEGYRFLIFDLQETTYINSCGLGLLVEFYNKASRLEGSVRVINCPPQVQWMLEQTQLSKILLAPPEAEPPAAELPYEPLFTLMSDEMLFLTQLHETTEQILGVEDLETIGSLVLKGLIRALHAQRGAFFLLSEDARRLFLACWMDLQENPAPPPLTEHLLQPGQLESKVLEEDAILWHELNGRDENEQNLFFRLGYDTFLIAPIRGRQARYGLVVLEAGPDTGKVMNASKPLVRTFANICGLAMEKTLSSQQVTRQSQALAEAMAKTRDCQQTLEESSRLAALGVVVSGLGHLINNKLVPLLGYSQMLTQKKDLTAWLSDKIARIHASGNELTQIVEKLVKVSHIRDKVRKPVDHASLLRTSLELLAPQLREEGILVHVQTDPALPPALGHPDLLLQAFLAILHRAATSFPAGSPEERWIRIASQVSGESIRITIEDNGGNFAECDQDGWLDPLVPVEAMEQGTIFSYTIPRGIIRKQQGKLTLAPREGSGKCIIIDLPIAKEADCVPEPASNQ